MNTAKQASREAREIPAPMGIETSSQPHASDGVVLCESVPVNITTTIPASYISGLQGAFDPQFSDISIKFDGVNSELDLMAKEFRNVYELLEYAVNHAAAAEYQEFYRKMVYFGCTDNEIKRMWLKKHEQ